MYIYIHIHIHIDIQYIFIYLFIFGLDITFDTVNFPLSYYFLINIHYIDQELGIDRYDHIDTDIDIPVWLHIKQIPINRFKPILTYYL